MRAVYISTDEFICGGGWIAEVRELLDIRQEPEKAVCIHHLTSFLYRTWLMQEHFKVVSLKDGILAHRMYAL